MSNVRCIDVGNGKVYKFVDTTYRSHAESDRLFEEMILSGWTWVGTRITGSSHTERREDVFTKPAEKPIETEFSQYAWLPELPNVV